ncbi:MAG: TPM domain-containing protein [Leptospira sp.]|nr:TPM domain-containing protein [Leptospira sp.]
MKFISSTRSLLRVILHLFIFHFAFATLSAQDLQSVLQLSGSVIDTVGILNRSTRERINTRILNLQKEKGSQIQVLIISSTKPESIEEYSIRVAEQWKLGRKGVDDGVLLVVAKDDRKLRIEVGYGLEGAIPDVVAKRIIDRIITPQFKNGNFSSGVEDGVSAIISLIRGEDLPALKSNWNDGFKGEKGESFLGFAYIIAIGVGLLFRVLKMGVLVFISMFLVIAISSFITGAQFIESIAQGIFFSGLVTAFLYGNGGGGLGTFSSGGGGFSSGGGGGWSGGGGSFGGGGSSGSW